MSLIPNFSALLLAHVFAAVDGDMTRRTNRSYTPWVRLEAHALPIALLVAVADLDSVGATNLAWKASDVTPEAGLVGLDGHLVAGHGSTPSKKLGPADGDSYLITGNPPGQNQRVSAISSFA